MPTSHVIYLLIFSLGVMEVLKDYSKSALRDHSWKVLMGFEGPRGLGDQPQFGHVQGKGSMHCAISAFNQLS